MVLTVENEQDDKTPVDIQRKWRDSSNIRLLEAALQQQTDARKDLENQLLLASKKIDDLVIRSIEYDRVISDYQRGSST